MSHEPEKFIRGEALHGLICARSSDLGRKATNRRASEKAVLMALALHVNQNTSACFPSVAQLRNRTELDRKTVLAALARLAKSDLIIDTELRRGRTQQVKVWKLAWSYTPKNTDAEESRTRCRSGSPERPVSIPQSGPLR